MKHPKNLSGPIIRKLRCQKGMTQPELAAKCNVMGWDISRETLAKIESQIRWVADFELMKFAKVFKVKVEDLLPSSDPFKH